MRRTETRWEGQSLDGKDGTSMRRTDTRQEGPKLDEKARDYVGSVFAKCEFRQQFNLD